MSHYKRTAFVLILGLMLAVPPVGSAYGPEVWTNLGLYGGNVQTLAVDPTDPRRVFAGVWFGEGLFRSVDGAATWQALKMEQLYQGEDTFENQALLALSISPTNPDVVWAAHNYWVARSVDGGDTWTHIYNSTVQRDCLNCGGWTDNFRFCFALASDPNDPETVYLGTAGAWSSYSEGAVYKTINGGIAWEKLNQGANLDYPVVSLAVDLQTPQVIWAATSSFGVGGVYDGTLYRSMDGGQSWTPIIPKPFTGSSLTGVTPHPADANVVFVTARAGVARVVFDGVDWSFTYPIAGCTQAYGLVFAPSNPMTIYAGWNTPMAWGGDGLPKVSRSVDGGLTWETYPVDPGSASLPKTLAVHPTDPEIVFLGDNSGGVLRSQDHGRTWVQVNTGLNGIVVKDLAVDAIDTAHMIAATSGGVYERTGATWQRRLSDNAQSVCFVPGSSSSYYAGLSSYLAGTRDGGATWTFSTQQSNGWIMDIAVDPVDSQTLFLADRSHVRRSTDGGLTFDPVLAGLNQAGEGYGMNTLALDPADHNHIYAGGGDFTAPKVLGDLWESKDGGDSWQRTGLTDVIVNAVAVDPRDSSLLYAGCGYSDNIDTPFFKSLDAGATWIPAENGLPTKSINLNEVWAASTTDVHAAGGAGSVLHFDGGLVQEILGGTYQDAALEGIFGIDAAHIYAAGADGTILKYDGSTWSPMQSGTTNYLYSIWGSAPSALFAVGVNGTILHFDGNAWNTMASGTSATLNKVFGTASDNVYAVGDAGTILHFDGSTWSIMPSPTADSLTAVWAAAADAVFAGGQNGTLIFFDGQAWSPMTSGASDFISGLWGSDTNNVYATIYKNGQFLHYDGTAWTSSTIPDAGVLNGIWGLSNGFLFVVDSKGGLYQYDGVRWTTLRPSGSRFRSITDLAFNRLNPDIIYASTYQAGVYISPNQADQWLNLGTPVLAVKAIASGSLYAATSGGLFQLTGTGVLAGDVYDRNSIAMLDGAWVTTDFGVGNRTIDGLYMLVVPPGNYDVYATADNYALGVAQSVDVRGADVTWVDFEMTTGAIQTPTGTNGNQSTVIGKKGSGAYCFIDAIADSATPLNGTPVLIGLFAAFFVAGIGVLLRLTRAITIAGLSAFFLFGYALPARGFTIFEQVGLASAPLPVGSGARAQGMGGAFIALADDATAASWNPAGLIQIEKPELSIVGAYVERSEAFTSTTSPEIDNTGKVSYGNLNYASVTFSSGWHKNFVVSLNYQRLYDFKRKFNYQRNLSAPGADLNQQICYDQNGFVGAIGLAGALEITPRVSIGATFNLWTDQAGYDNGWSEKYSEAASGTQSGVPVTIDTKIQDTYDQFRGVNFNLGLLWDTENWGTFGLVVKTPFTATIQHRFQFSQTTTFGSPVNSVSVSGPLTVEEEVELYLPISYGLGWSRRFNDAFTLGIDIYRTEWDDYCLTNSQGEKFSPIDGRPKGQSNVDATTAIRVGAEYLFLIPKHNMGLALRAGLFRDPEPGERSNNDVFGIALGAGLTFQRCSLDMAYQLRWGKDTDSGNLIADSDADVTQHTLMASVIYYF